MPDIRWETCEISSIRYNPRHKNIKRRSFRDHFAQPEVNVSQRVFLNKKHKRDLVQVRSNGIIGGERRAK